MPNPANPIPNEDLCDIIAVYDRLLAKYSNGLTTSDEANSRRPSIANLEQTIAQEALSAHAASSRQLNKPPPSNKTTQRVGLAVIEPFVINSRNSLGYHLVGSKGSKILFSIFRGPLGAINFLFFTVGMIVPCFAFLGYLDYKFSYLILLAIPSWVGSYSVLNVELLRQILHNFDSLLLLVYSTFAVLGLLISLRDERILMCVVGLIGLYNIILFDAAPEKWRRTGGKVSTTMCCLFVGAVLFSIFLEKIPGLHLSYFTVGKTTYSSIDVTFLSGIQVVIFYFHQISNLIWFPSCFSLLTSRMKSVKVEKKSADILTSVHERLNVDTKSKSKCRKSNTTKPFDRSKDDTEQAASDLDSSIGAASHESRDSSGVNGE
ncbi:hypothetical protein TrLO_g8796 [Triparma laevis f. longispina]|uniref:Transmembrane protein n=1 Tax=Triparma laevis f. longispina TaxID=1714387 RepID=A0A9W7EDN8_9STRA|nr:hypothetical protein TrLO_g8796 [Triparma laevis f. longispina]